MSGECNVCDQMGCVEFRHCAFRHEIEEASAERDRLVAALRHYMIETCPCGARNDSLDTHSHVAGCPVGAVLELLATA